MGDVLFIIFFARIHKRSKTSSFFPDSQKKFSSVFIWKIRNVKGKGMRCEGTEIAKCLLKMPWQFAAGFTLLTAGPVGGAIRTLRNETHPGRGNPGICVGLPLAYQPQTGCLVSAHKRRHWNEGKEGQDLCYVKAQSWLLEPWSWRRRPFMHSQPTGEARSNNQVIPIKSLFTEHTLLTIVPSLHWWYWSFKKRL